MGKRLNRTLLSILVAATGGILTGCSLPSPGAARLIDGGVEFVSCDAVDTAILVVEVRALDRSDTWHEMWAAEGAGLFDQTATVVYGELPDGFVETQTPEAIDIGTQEIALFIRSTPDENGGSDQAAWISVDGSKLSNSQWLDQNEKLQDEPCPKSP